MTSYLMFKVSLLGWDHDLGRQSIVQLTKSSDLARRRDILYACVREAQQFGDRLCTLESLKAVANSWTIGGVASESLPAILRCTIRLMHMDEDENDVRQGRTEKPDFSEDICKVFSRGVSRLRSRIVVRTG